MVPTLGLFLLFTGCGGDVTSATGELGRVRYSIYTTYNVDERPLDEVLIVTGHTQSFRTELTEDGEKKADEDAWRIFHRYDPASNVEIWSDEGDEEDRADDIPGFDAVVTEPGTYTVESMLDDEVFDYLDLQYESPDGLEVLAWVRDRDGEEFELREVGGTIKVDEGAQAAFLPIPTSGSQRLVGDIATELESDPEDAVIRAENVLGVYEQRVVSSPNPVNIYFTDPGLVTITLIDPVHGVSATVDFDVANVGT